MTDRTVMNYLLSDKEWWEFLPTLLKETAKQVFNFFFFIYVFFFFFKLLNF